MISNDRVIRTPNIGIFEENQRTPQNVDSVSCVNFPLVSAGFGRGWKQVYGRRITVLIWKVESQIFPIALLFSRTLETPFKSRYYSHFPNLTC